MYSTLSAVCKLSFTSYSDYLLPNYQQNYQNRLVSFNHENVRKINVVVSGIMRNNASETKEVNIH